MTVIFEFRTVQFKSFGQSTFIFKDRPVLNFMDRSLQVHRVVYFQSEIPSSLCPLDRHLFDFRTAPFLNS